MEGLILYLCVVTNPYISVLEWAVFFGGRVGLFLLVILDEDTFNEFNSVFTSS